MTSDELNSVCSKLAEGKSLRSICREMGKPESSVRYWLNKDEEAFAHSARARELGCDALADECLEIADGDQPSDVKRIRIDTRIRLIGKWSQRYSDRVTVKSEGTVTHRHDLDNLSDDELNALERILSNAGASQGSEGAEKPSQLH